MKKYLLFIIIFLSQQAMAYDIWVKPQIGYNFNQDNVLKKYFMKEIYLSYGIASDLILKNGFGLFVEVSAYNFIAEEDFSNKEYSSDINGKWVILGICKKYTIPETFINFIPRIGCTYHHNYHVEGISTISDIDKNLSGIMVGLDLNFEINENVMVGIVTKFNDISYKFPDERVHSFTRHNYYLNNRKITDSHFLLGANFSIKVK